MPGTGLARTFPFVLRWLFVHVLPHLIWLLRLAFGPNIHTSRESGAALARLVLAKDLQGVNGVYYEGLEVRPTSQESLDERKQEDLWTWTMQHLARDAAERARFEDF